MVSTESEGNEVVVTNKEQVDGAAAKQNECQPDATTTQKQVDGTISKQNEFHPDATTNKEQVDETIAKQNECHADATTNKEQVVGNTAKQKCKDTKTLVFRTLSIFDLMNNPPATISEYCKPLLFVKFRGQTSDEKDEVFNV